MDEPAHGVGADKAEKPKSHQDDCNGVEHVAYPYLNACANEESLHPCDAAVTAHAHHAQRVVRLGPTSGPDLLSVVLPDLKVAVNRPDVLGVARNGHGLVGGFLGSSAASQPYDSILDGVDMNAPQAG